jgi:hypothetical protein
MAKLAVIVMCRSERPPPDLTCSRRPLPQNDQGTHKTRNQSRLKESSPRSWFALCQKDSRNTLRSSPEHDDSAPLNWQISTAFPFASSIFQTLTFWKFRSWSYL